MAQTPEEEAAEKLKAWREQWEADAKARKEKLEQQAEDARAARRAQENANDLRSGRNKGRHGKK